jgi:hypothetical protein
MVEATAGPKPEGGGGAPGGGEVGRSSAIVPPPPVPTAPPRKPGPVKCKKGFQRKKIHGKTKCVKVRKPPGKHR